MADSNQPQVHIPPTITISQSAADKVWELVQAENAPDLMLRVYIEGGGCSGFQYGFTFDDEKQQGDTFIQPTATSGNKVTFAIDRLSYQYLVGSEIDYKADLEGERFIIRNPNAATTCGCGSSFSIE